MKISNSIETKGKDEDKKQESELWKEKRNETRKKHWKV